MQEIITLDAYLMGRDKTYPKDYNDDVKNNAIKLLAKVNQFLSELGITTAVVSSGWRPPQINASIPNSAKKSLHMVGLAVDIKDDAKQTLGRLVASRPDLLRKHELFLEDLSSTKGWVHLDCGTRSDRPSRTFKP